LNPPDKLLVDDSQLQPYEAIRDRLTEEQKNLLWVELFGGFKINDKVSIINCLARGASVDRQDDHKEYPIHMAARVSDTNILQMTYLPETIPDHLLKRTTLSKPH
jgi:hypothetical protein